MERLAKSVTGLPRGVNAAIVLILLSCGLLSIGERQ
jgi:hypothetical protein